MAYFFGVKRRKRYNEKRDLKGNALNKGIIIIQNLKYKIQYAYSSKIERDSSIFIIIIWIYLFIFADSIEILVLWVFYSICLLEFLKLKS